MTGRESRLRLRLLTQGNPRQLTGGYLYQQRMAAEAHAEGAELSFLSIGKGLLPLQILEVRRALPLTDACDGVLVDSIVAAAATPWLRPLRRSGPLIALVHQQPGGVDSRAISRAVRKRLDLRLYRRADAVIAVSEWLAKGLSNAGVPSIKVVAIPPGRDLDARTLSPPHDLRGGRQAAVVCISNWLRNKSVHLALEALSRLQPDLVTLHLIGDTAMDAAYAGGLHRRIAQPDLEGRVVIHERVPPQEVRRLLSGTDFLVHPSRHEAYGAVVAEAMTLGLPVIASRIDNLPYLVRNGVDGFLVPYGDMPAFSAAIALLATDVKRREAMGAAAAARAMTWPTWPQAAERFFSVIRNVVAGYTAMRR